jgi:hypothetical protein
MQALVLPNACCPPGSFSLGTSQLSLLTTLRKFLISCTTLPEPDKELAVHVTLAFEDLLGRLAAEAVPLADNMTTAGGVTGAADVGEDSAQVKDAHDWGEFNAGSLCQVHAPRGKLQLLVHALVQLLPSVQVSLLSGAWIHW